MLALAEMISKGFVRIKATVYVHAPGGMAAFIDDMRKQGANTVPVDSYEMNDAQTNALRPWTGAVWFSNLTDEVRAEIKSMMDERGSQEMIERNGEIRIYNNPLFRTIVALGIWTNESTERRIANMLGRQFDRLADEIIKIEAEISSLEHYAKVNRNAGFVELSKDYSSKATQLRHRLSTFKSRAEEILASLDAA